MITLDTTPNRTYENSGTFKVKIQDPGAWMEGPRLRIMHEETRVQDPTWGTLNTINIQNAVHYMEVPEQFQAHKPSQDSGRRTQKNIYKRVWYLTLSCPQLLLRISTQNPRNLSIRSRIPPQLNTCQVKRMYEIKNIYNSR